MSILLLSTTLTGISLNFQDYSIEAASLWTKDNEEEFLNGTLKNVYVKINGSSAELKLDKIESGIWLDQMCEYHPSGRHNHAMSTIYGTDKIMLFGGSRNSNRLNDTWVYDLGDNSWFEMHPDAAPLGRWQHAMAGIPGDDKVVLYGGSYGGIDNVTWIYDLSLNNWTQKFTNVTPPRLGNHAMATIHGTDSVLIFGGYGYPGSPGPTYLNETWAYSVNNNTWTNLTKPHGPSRRTQHAMTPVWNTDKIILFGGHDISFNNETWVFDFSESNWTKVNVKNHPTGRFSHAMAMVYGTDKIVMYSGPNSKGVNDTWVFDLSEERWYDITPEISPEKRQQHKMAGFYGSQKALMFGDIWLLNDTWVIDLDSFLTNGSYITKPYDIGEYSSLKTIHWNCSISKNTSIKFQVRTSGLKNGLNKESFVGPTGSIDSYYNSSPATIWPGHNGKRWVQYIVYFDSTEINETPILKDVSLIYNIWPEVISTSPVDHEIMNHTNPIFGWEFSDIDSEYQTSFQIIIDDDLDFQSINYNIENNSIALDHWTFPGDTEYESIPDGTWFWKIRVKDNDGNWSLFSDTKNFTIDTQSPLSLVNYPIDNGTYNQVNKISGTAEDANNGTGLKKIVLNIQKIEDGQFWNGSTWIPEKVWLSANGTNEWFFNLSSSILSSGESYRIQSKATDNAFNTEQPSNGIIFTYDSEHVRFSDPKPSITEFSKTETVEVGITITDDVTEVNASSIMYTTSYDNGTKWSSWYTINGYKNSSSIDIRLNITFPNGTGNRIKWRAADTVGNGPVESSSYPVHVNTWMDEKIIPIVRLWSPPNNTGLEYDSINLSWFLVTHDLLDVVYDVYLDTEYPPRDMVGENITDTFLVLDDLENEKTYYWTVVPKYGEVNGICEAGIWSFNVDIPLPKTILQFPLNGSSTTTLQPTLAWTLYYNGTENVRYNLYFGEQNDFKLIAENITNKYHLLELSSEVNTTYYWYVAPWAADLRGITSEIWWFTVNFTKDKEVPKPQFELKLELEPQMVELYAGEEKVVKAVITNLGDLVDRVFIQIEGFNRTDVNIQIQEQNLIEITPGANDSILLYVSAGDEIKADEFEVTVKSYSLNAHKHNLTGCASDQLTIKLLEKDDGENGRDKPVFGFNIMDEWIVLFIFLIIVIIVIVIIGLLRNQKNKIVKNDVEEDIEE